VVFALIAVFSYTQISKSFIANQASSLLIKTGETIQKRIDYQIAFDYENLKVIIEQYENQDLDPVFELRQNINSIKANDQNYDSFGLISNNTIEINGIIYTFVQSYDEQEYLEEVQIFSFSDAFGIGNNQKKLMFRIGDIAAFLDLSDYLSEIQNMSNLSFEYVIMGNDNLIYFQSISQSNVRFLYD
jgi:hypothetical protein